MCGQLRGLWTSIFTDWLTFCSVLTSTNCFVSMLSLRLMLFLTLFSPVPDLQLNKQNLMTMLNRAMKTTTVTMINIDPTPILNVIFPVL